MKVLWVVLAVFLTLCIFIGIHSYIISNMAEDILEKCEIISHEIPNENWKSILKTLDRIDETWDKHHMWATITVNTKDIEEIEIALSQSRAFAEAKQISGFIGEFVMFTELVKHIPIREGIHLEEIL